MAVTMLQINNAISDTLAEIASITVDRGAGAEVLTVYTYGATEIKEGMPDIPSIQVYPETGAVDMSGNTDRTTFGQGATFGVRQEDQTWNIDLYATRRSHFAEDMAVLLPFIDVVTDKLEDQDNKPFFGLNAIQAFRWNWQRAIFPFAQGEYVGCRFILTVRIF